MLRQKLFSLDIAPKLGVRGIKILNMFFMLTIIMLITANSANAIPQGTLIKGGVLTYPAGPYLKENPLLIDLENYTVGDDKLMSDEPVEIIYPENQSQIFDSNNQDASSKNLDAWKFLILPSNPFYVCCKSNMGARNPCPIFSDILRHLTGHFYPH